MDSDTFNARFMHTAHAHIDRHKYRPFGAWVASQIAAK
jgi:hypothetical protein